MSLDALRAQLPDYAKDLRLNLESLASKEDMERRRDEVLQLIRS